MADIKSKLGSHPNAVVAGASAGSAAALVTIAAAFGLSIPLEAAVWIVAAVPPAMLALGRKGIVGLWRQLLHGSEG